MEEFISKLTALIAAEFPGSMVEFTRSGPRVGSMLTWSGFDDLSQIERQRRVWQFLRAKLDREEQLKVAAVLTLTPEETTAAKAG